MDMIIVTIINSEKSEEKEIGNEGTSLFNLYTTCLDKFFVGGRGETTPKYNACQDRLPLHHS